MKQSNKETIVKLCQTIITSSFSSLFFLVPLIFTPLNYELFEFNKMLLVYFFTIIIAAFWLVKSVVSGRFQITRTPLDIPILLFLLSQIISTIISIDPHISIFGYYGRFNGGLLSTISYIILYYALISNLSNLSNLVTISLSSGLLVSFYAILQKLGIDKHLWVQDVVSRPFSTLGQPNWLAAYLAILLPIAIALALNSKSQTLNSKQIRNPKSQIQNKKLKFGFLNFENWDLFRISDLGFRISALVFYTVLLFTRSRSGFLAFWLTNAIFLLLFLTITISHLLKKRKSQFFITIVGNNVTFTHRIFLSLTIINFGFLLITFLIGSPFPKLNKYFSLNNLTSYLSLNNQLPATPPPTDVTESGEIRKIVWKGAFEAFKARPLTGWGVETFAWVYYKFKPVEHNLTSEWDFLYNKAHNEYLNYAATTGLFGLGSYLLIIGTFIFWNLNKLKVKSQKLKVAIKSLKLTKNKKLLTPDSDFAFCTLHFALFCGWLSILITNFFGFSVVPVALYFWLIPAMVFTLSSPISRRAMPRAPQKSLANQQAIAVSRNKIQKFWRLLALFLISFFIFHFSFFIFNLWRADSHFAQAHSLNRAGDYPKAYPQIIKALNLSPGEPLYYDELSIINANLALTLSWENPQNPQIPELLKQAISASDYATNKSPHSLNFWKTRTRMFYTLTQLPAGSQQPEAGSYLSRALEAILTAQELAPTDAKVSYNLALLYEANGERQKAIETLKKTLELKPDYQDAQEALGLFLEEKL